MPKLGTEFESSVVGAFLLTSDVAEQVVAALTVDDFQIEYDRQLFLALQKRVRSGEPIDANLLVADCGGDKDLRKYCYDCMQIAPVASNLPLYIDKVVERRHQLRLSKLAESIPILLEQGDTDEIIDMIRQTTDKMTSKSAKAVNSMDMFLGWAKYFDDIRKNPDGAYTKTGYPSLDNAFGGGLFNSELYILAGRPGLGKTTCALNIAESVSKSRPILFVSIEMSNTQIACKRLALGCGVSYTATLNGSLNLEDYQLCVNKLGNIAEHKFYTVDSINKVRDIERYARGIDDLGLIVVDYLGLIQSDEQYAKSRYEEVTKISADLKALAKRLNKPILVLAQLNRENTRRNGNRPTMSDLRDSGAIEQDAGAVILLHREEYYQEETQSELQDLEMIIAKNRHASPQTVKLHWWASSGTITDIIPSGKESS